MSTDTGTGAQSRLDFTMMYATHDAFRRDLSHLVPAADSRTGDLRAFREGWSMFKYYLTIHHTAEDKSLWPPIRRQVGSDAERLALLDAMEAEHAVLDPLMASVDAMLSSGGTAKLRETMEELAAALTAHLENEEVAGLPLVDAVLSEKEWDVFGEEQRAAVGTKGAAHFFPWVLDGATPGMEEKVLALVPPPIRFLYRKQWRPKYLKRSPWGQASRA
jgi:iron-sulfur cluster repair protein YtfE (RIC family)